MQKISAYIDVLSQIKGRLDPELMVQNLINTLNLKKFDLAKAIASVPNPRLCNFDYRPSNIMVVDGKDYVIDHENYRRVNPLYLAVSLLESADMDFKISKMYEDRIKKFFS